MILRDFVLTDDDLFWHQYSLFLDTHRDFHDRQVDEAFRPWLRDQRRLCR